MCQLLEPKYRTTKLWCSALFYSFKRLLVTIKKLPIYEGKMLITKLSKNIEIIFVNMWNKNPFGVFLHSDRTVLLFRRTERDDEDNWAVWVGEMSMFGVHDKKKSITCSLSFSIYYKIVTLYFLFCLFL